MQVVGFGTYDILRHPRVGVILDGLRQRGAEVSEVNVPMGFSTAERVSMLARPWTAYRFVFTLLRCWLRLLRSSRSSGKEDVDVVVVGYLGHFDVLLANLLFPHALIVLDMLVFAADTARDRGAAGRLRLALLGALDRVAVRAADLVLVDTDEQVFMITERDRGKAVVVPVGAPKNWFVESVPQVSEGPLTVMFFGLFTPLQGAPTIGAAISMLRDRSDVRFTMVGSGQDLETARELASGNGRVTWTPWVDAVELPGLVAGHDVCLGIFGTSAKAVRVTPNKVFQGAAAGCAIVTSDTPPQRRSMAETALFTPPGDAEALADTIRRLADDRALVSELGRAARARAETEFTPSAVIESLMRKLGN